ncbi:MAG: hypothetical protein DDT39_01421 [Firmicutes bacterium]|nr:hypothetical protein [candidate division NPL-UPA2 bacterium]MBT9153320.1 hypothetical protein [Bacillota bacterium]MBT9154742.1 hypothetical protein [candidate division NPL-UPA2 bacterium]
MANVQYYDREGQINLTQTIEAVKERLSLGDVTTVIVFTGNGTGALQAAEQLVNTHVLAVTFSWVRRGDSVGGIQDESVRQALAEKGIRIIEGNLPFDEIIIPDARDPKITAIEYTLDLFGGGMSLCVQAVIMATEQGLLEPSKDVIAMSGDTAIVATPARKSTMFSPYDGMEIREIICKPRHLTLVRKPKYEA